MTSAPARSPNSSPSHSPVQSNASALSGRGDSQCHDPTSGSAASAGRTPDSISDRAPGKSPDRALEKPLDKTLHSQALPHAILISILLAAATWTVQHQLAAPLTQAPSSSPWLITIALWSLILLLAGRGLRWHQHATFGAANTVTLLRAAGTVLLAGMIPLASELSVQALWLVTGLSVVLLAMDGVDGYLARHSGLISDFGARFDMEIDALLTLVISVLLWRSGELGIWVLALGMMRYAFVLASRISPALQQPLFPSFRRKCVCVIQLAALCAILSPLVQPPVSTWLGAFALLCLSASFARDIQWLYRAQSR